MAVNEQTVLYIKDQLSDFADVEIKKMFGGIGIFLDGIMFGMITSKEQFMMRVGETNIQDYEAAGSKPLGHEKKKGSMPYWEVPENVVDDRKALKEWATKAYDVAVAAKKKK